MSIGVFVVHEQRSSTSAFVVCGQDNARKSPNAYSFGHYRQAQKQDTMFNIDKDKLKRDIDKVNLQCDSIEKKIGKFLVDSALSEQKILELCQVGKFLTLFDNDNIEIIEQCESPDFIISVNGMRIGLEHELILNGQNVKQIQSIKIFLIDYR